MNCPNHQKKYDAIIQPDKKGETSGKNAHGSFADTQFFSIKEKQTGSGRVAHRHTLVIYIP